MRERDNLRIPVSSLGEVGRATLSAGSIDLSLLNISAGGLAVVSAQPLGDIDDWLVIEIDSPNTQELVCLPCSLRYVIGERETRQLGQPRWLSGARFERLPVQGRVFVDWCLRLHQERQIDVS